MGEAKRKSVRYETALAVAKAQKKRRPKAPVSAPTSAERAAMVLSQTRARNATLPAPENGVMTRQRRRRAALRLERTHGISRHV